MKTCEICGTEIDTKDAENRCESCDEAKTKTKAKRARANAARRARHEALTSLGLTRVKGALGGVYYE